MSQQIIDLAIVYRIIKMLILDWKDMPAFKLGIIDEHGNILKQPKTQKEKDAYTVLNKLVFRLRRYLQKVPQFARDFISLAAAIHLVKECVERNHEPNDLEQLFEQVKGMVSTDDEKSLVALLESTECIEFMLTEEDLYHGSTENFDKFEIKPGLNGTIFGPEEVERHGVFASTNKNYAKKYAGKNGVLYKIRHSLKNPFDMRKGVSEKMESDFVNAGGNTRILYSGLPDWELFDGGHGKHMVDTIKKAGYDHAIIKDERVDGEDSDSHIIFNPNSIQIDNKSRIEENTLNHPMVEVDGVMKHRNNSNGVPIHNTDEGIRNFHRWFGNSKAVDQHGRPKVLYHGTHHDISEFKPSKSGVLGGGVYLTDTKWHAGHYAQADKANIIPVYARLENPYVEHSFDDESPSETHARKTKIYFNGGTDKILGDMGHDGVHHDLGNLQVFVAHHPSQVKSAIGNNGSYSKNSHVITEEGEGVGNGGGEGTALGAVPGNNTFADVHIPGTGDSGEAFVNRAKLFPRTIKRKQIKIKR